MYGNDDDNNNNDNNNRDEILDWRNGNARDLGSGGDGVEPTLIQI